jgi:hypothetical protein
MSPKNPRLSKVRDRECNDSKPSSTDIVNKLTQGRRAMQSNLRQKFFEIRSKSLVKSNFSPVDCRRSPLLIKLNPLQSESLRSKSNLKGRASLALRRFSFVALDKLA